MREIKNTVSFEECEDFVCGFCSENAFSEPALSDVDQIRQDLKRAIKETENYAVLTVFDKQKPVGLFSFLVIKEERYLEMLIALSNDKEAYDEMLRYLQKQFAGYDVDFVFNPNNVLLYDLLKQQGAEFDIEQQKMVLTQATSDMDVSGIELLSEKYIPSYLEIHNTDLYWTGEKVIQATDRFRVLVTIENERVVGYLDVTYTFDENQPFDLFVQKEYRRKGYGRKLLAKALEMNKPCGMMLYVNVDNEPAIHLYESSGFEKMKNQNHIVAHYQM